MRDMSDHRDALRIFVQKHAGFVEVCSFFPFFVIRLLIMSPLFLL